MSYSFSIPKTAVAEAPAALLAAEQANSAGFSDDDFGNDQKEGSIEAVEAATSVLLRGYFDTAKTGVTVSISGHGRKRSGANSAAPTMNISISGQDY